MPDWTRGKIVTTILLAVLPFAYFYEAVLGRVALVQGDGWLANLGLRILLGKLLTEGILPLWNPYLFGGMPLLASAYPGVLYPPNWLFAVLPPGVAMNLLVITTFHVALIGAYRYARCLGCQRVAALVTGLGFAFGGYMVMSLGQTSNIAAAAWLPWILLALEKLYRQTSWRWLTLGAIFIALQFFAGVPQMTWHTIITGGLYFLFTLLAREPQVTRGRFALSVGLLCAAGALLSAVQLFPLRELQQLSGRAALRYEQFAEFSFPAKQVWALFVPFLFGGATMPPYRVPYWGETAIYVTCGYVGLLSWMLAALAVLRGRQAKLVWFWAGLAGLSLLLAFGAHLPFQLNRLLYALPVYNLFRASFRHLFEFTFALAVLAGLGLDWLTRRAAVERLSAWGTSWALLGGCFGVALVVCFGGAAYSGQLPATARSLTNPELLLPLFFLLLSGFALWCYARQPGRLSSGFLLTVFLLDLAAYGHALYWRAYPYQMYAALADPPAVQFIKRREHDWNSFRMLSLTAQPFGPGYGALNYPNISLARGLQSVNGYDMLRLTEPAQIMGAMTPEGVVTELDSLSPAHQGFNLLNVKYLLRERGLPHAAANDLLYEGVRFAEAPLDLHLRHGTSHEFRPAGALADQLLLVTTLSNAGQLTDGTAIAQIKLFTEDGKSFEFELQAGRDTAEWAYDRADVKLAARHRRAAVIESWPEAGFEGQRYLARFGFARGNVARIELRHLRQDAALVIFRASLHDQARNLSYAVDSPALAGERWKRLTGDAEVDIYENLAARPRAWLVGKLAPLSHAEILQTIKTGRLPNGEVFRPEQLGLIERDGAKSVQLSDRLNAATETPAAEAKVLSYSPNVIEAVTNSAQAGMLILSEIHYPGWSARVDGLPAEVYRVDGVLRGVLLTAGQHRVSFQFRSSSLRLGVAGSLLGVALLAGCWVGLRRLPQRKRE